MNIRKGFRRKAISQKTFELNLTSFSGLVITRNRFKAILQTFEKKNASRIIHQPQLMLILVGCTNYPNIF
jgi:hypothetical protein